MTNEELASLAQRIKDGDEIAFHELYEQMWKPFCYIASRHLDNREEAMDAAQDTLVTVYQDIHKLKANIAFYAWMMRILYSKCASVIGTKKRKPTINFDDVSEAQLVDQMNLIPEELVLDKEANSRISQMVSDLSEEQRVAILLFYYCQLSTKEIAKVMNLSTNAVTIKLSRARVNLKKKLEKLAKRGDVLYGLAPFTLMTRFFVEDAEQVCTLEMKDILWNRVHLGIETAAISVGSTIGRSAIKSFMVKLGIGVVSAVTVVGSMLVIINWQQSSRVDIPNTANPSVLLASASVAPTTTTQLSEYGSLPWMVGEADAQKIMSFSLSIQENHNSDFKEMLRQHQIKYKDNFFDEADENSMYVFFTLSKEGKKLVLCEFYNSTRKEWAVKYDIYEESYLLPQNDNIKKWFYDH